MLNTRKIGISIRFYPALMEMIDELANLEFQGNVTETIVSLTNDGLKLRKLQKTLKEHPEKADEMITELNEKIKNESIFPFLDSLSDQQKRGFIDYLNMKLE
jgi:hypothetical protein